MNCTKNTLKSVSDYCFKTWENETFDFDLQCSPEMIHGPILGTATIVSSSIGVIGNILTISSLLYCIKKEK
jgi:hypothetical protein